MLRFFFCACAALGWQRLLCAKPIAFADGTTVMAQYGPSIRPTYLVVNNARLGPASHYR
jgi:hypothetical protein